MQAEGEVDPVDPGEEPNESAWNEEAVEGQLDELDDEELEDLADDEEEGLE
jgi:hypothetical protein